MIALTAGYLLKVTLSDMLPFVWCGLVICLYALAFTRHLSTIDILFPAVAAALVIYLVINRNKCRDFGGYVKENLLSAPCIIYVILAVVIVAGVSSKMVTWWDDINFWASDLKSLYYLDGFASKYANVSAEFGDYPPGGQLAKWFVVHMNRDGFKESLAFTGYYLFNFSFVMPVYKKIEGKSKIAALPLAIVTWLIPGMADKFGYAGFCADLSMAFLLGGILIAAVDEREDAKLFDYLRVALYMSVLVIVKSTGPFWVIIGFVIYTGYRLLNVTRVTKTDILKNLSVAAFPFTVGLSWMLFCLIRHRVTKTTTTAITYLTTDKYGVSGYTSDFATAFVKAFFTEPLYVDHVWIIVPPAVIILLLAGCLILLVKKNILKGKAGRFYVASLLIFGVAYYLLIFIAHITIFAMETQYLESSAMIASIERYGLPFMLGTILFLIYIWLSEKIEPVNDAVKIAVLMAVIVLMCNLPAAFDGLIGYRNHLDNDIATKNEIIDDKSKTYIEVVENKLLNGNVRVCRVHDGSYYWVGDAYTAYEVSPVSTLTVSFNLDEIDVDTLIYAVSQTHAAYLYFDEQDSEAESLNELFEDGRIKYKTLYFISYENGAVLLREI